MNDVDEFKLAKNRAEGARQGVVSAARRTFEASREPGRQHDYDVAVRDAERVYFTSVIFAAERFGIDPTIYRRGLARVS